MGFQLGELDYSPAELGFKGMAFLACLLVIVVASIMYMTGLLVMSKIVGGLAILLSILGCVATGARNVVLLGYYIYGSCVVFFALPIGALVMALGWQEFLLPPYIGLGIMAITLPLAIWLAYDGRGRTLSLSEKA